MSNKHKAMAALGGLLLLEAFLQGAISRTAARAGVNGAALAVAGMLAAAVVAQLD